HHHRERGESPRLSTVSPAVTVLPPGVVATGPRVSAGPAPPLQFSTHSIDRLCGVVGHVLHGDDELRPPCQASTLAAADILGLLRPGAVGTPVVLDADLPFPPRH